MVKENPLVSIIIPFYNSKEFLAETLDSAIWQTWENKEIILIDDGSDDGGLDVALKYESDIVKVYRQDNKGASSARNAGLILAKGEYIQFLDADDVLAPGKIENQLLQLLQEKDGAVASGPFINFVDIKLNKQSVRCDKGFTSFEHPVDWLVEALSGFAMFPTVVWLTPFKTIEAAGSWNEDLNYNDDSEFFTRVLLKSKKIVFCENAVSYYRRGNPQSLGSRKDYKARKSEIDSLDLVAEHILNFEKSDRVRNACAVKYCKLYFSLYPEYKVIRQSIMRRLKEFKVKPKFDYGKGFTSRVSKLIGWKAARSLRYYTLKVLKPQKA